MNTERRIFRKGSTTFFTSSLFFPRQIRKDVFDLYSFVRVADDYVDQVPANAKAFRRLKKLWEGAVCDHRYDTNHASNDSIDIRVTKNMVRLCRKYEFDPEWVEAFLKSMESDLSPKPCRTLDDTLEYIYGSAEVIGLMMARIMGLDPAADETAKLQGRAMQMINFIRDIEEDNRLGRQYFPNQELKRFKLKDLSRKTASSQPEDFQKFIHFQLGRYFEWQNQAAAGYKYVPRRLLVPLKTASDMYKWTAENIQNEPLTIYAMKIKPRKTRVIKEALKQTFKRDRILSRSLSQ